MIGDRRWTLPTIRCHGRSESLLGMTSVVAIPIRSPKTSVTAFSLLRCWLLAANFGMPFLATASAGHTRVVSRKRAVARRMTHSVTVAALDSGWVGRLVTIFGNVFLGVAVAASAFLAVGTVFCNVLLQGLLVMFRMA